MDVEKRARLVEQAARRLGTDLAEAREAFDRAEREPGREIRLCRHGERRGRSSCSVRFVADGPARGFLVHCFKTGEGGFFALSTSAAGPLASPDAALAHARAAVPSPDREAKRALARAIAEEGQPPSAWRGRRASPDYARAKGLAGFRAIAERDFQVPPCPAIRYAARDYALRGRRLLLAGTPFWALSACRDGEVRGVQFKFWSWRFAAWQTRTIGSQSGTWIDLPKDSPAAGAATPIVLAEGISTAWALHRLLDGRHRVIATLGLGGLPRCAQAAAGLGKGQGVAIVADLDRDGQGERAAIRAARAVAGTVHLPLLREASPAVIARARARGFDAWDLWVRLNHSPLSDGLAALWSVAPG